jgi:hypothetical protein
VLATSKRRQKVPIFGVFAAELLWIHANFCPASARCPWIDQSSGWPKEVCVRAPIFCQLRGRKTSHEKVVIPSGVSAFGSQPSLARHFPARLFEAVLASSAYPCLRRSALQALVLQLVLLLRPDAPLSGLTLWRLSLVRELACVCTHCASRLRQCPPRLHMWLLSATADRSGMLHGSKLVDRMADELRPDGASLEGPPYVIACDNYFTSVELVRSLANRNILAIGTVRADRRGLPYSIVKPEVPLATGESVYATTDDGIAVMTWMDKKPVHFLFNCVSPAEVGTVYRRDASTSKQKAVPAPAAAERYQRNMQSVDRHNQFSGQYVWKHKAIKWWHTLFFDMLQLAVVNSWIIAKESLVSRTASRVHFADTRAESGEE